MPTGDYVFFEVTDNGRGMSKETIARVFDPFFTTKFTGRGLGMSAVQGIIRGHNGLIKLYSEVGRGSTFKILFPANVSPVGRPTGLPDEPAAEDLYWCGQGTVVVVDDEELVREIAIEMTRQLGFDVIGVEDGQAAVELIEQSNDEIACVLLDLTMPRMDGEQAFKALCRVRPNLPIILCSGFDESDATPRFSGMGLAGFIQKPFSMSRLRGALRTAVDSNSGEPGLPVEYVEPG